jgi:protein O-GlcNAc transferase
MDRVVATHPPDLAMTLDQAIQDQQAGCLAAAEAAYLRILAQDPCQPDALHLLGMLSCDRGDFDAGLRMVDVAIGLQPFRSAFHNTRGHALALSGRLAEAETAYHTAWTLRPNTMEIANNLGCLLRDRGDVSGAIEWLGRASTLAPDSMEVAGNLADILASTGADGRCLLVLRQALLLHPNSSDTCNRIARLLLKLGQLEEAERSFNAALQARPNHAATQNDLGVVLADQGRTTAALECFRDALRCDPHCADAYYNQGCMLQLDNRIDAARECHKQAIDADRLHGRALWARCMVELPILYQAADDIPLQRTRFTRQLEALSARAEDPKVARSLAASVGACQPFFLPYQGECDLGLKGIYGTLVARVLQTANKTPAEWRPRGGSRGDQIRIGIVSGFFREHTIWRLMLKGWLSQLDRGRFSICAYHTSMIMDDQTALARRLSARFVGGTGVDIRAAILADEPTVLLYPELGIDPVAARLAGERLASIQCVSWGQPETSGLPTMDFFLSSELMEPEDAASHYTERLVALPNLGIYYAPDEREAEECSREALGLRNSAAVFWCGQALYKYLPQYDEVFTRIASEVTDCQFVFIGFAKSQNVTECFHSRLRQAFAKRGLDADRHCVFLAPMSQERFLGTIRLADVMLDSITWSGGKSTLDALAVAPVIVTHCGHLMRGRHTTAILRRLGVTETIAATLDDYVSIAVSLAHDSSMRAALRARMAAGRCRVMADTVPIRALEVFLTNVVEQYRDRDGMDPIKAG